MRDVDLLLPVKYMSHIFSYRVRETASNVDLQNQSVETMSFS